MLLEQTGHRAAFYSWARNCRAPGCCSASRHAGPQGHPQQYFWQYLRCLQPITGAAEQSGGCTALPAPLQASGQLEPPFLG